MGLPTRFLSVFCFFALIAAFIGCDSGEVVETAQAPPVIRVGHVGHDHHLALYVAALVGQELNSYGDVHLRQIQPREVYDLVEGDNVLARLQFVKVGGGSKMPAAMGRGEIDLGLGGITPIAKIADKGSDIKVITPLQTDGDMLIMKADWSGGSWDDFIEFVKKSDRPVRMGYKAPVAVAKLIFERALKYENINYSYDMVGEGLDVLLVNMSTETAYLPLLEKGTIDGYVMNQPAAAFAQHKGVGKIVCDLSDLPPSGKWRGHPCCCAAATGDIIKSRPEVVRGFVKLLKAGSRMINADKQRAIALASQWTHNDIEIEKLSIPSIGYIDGPCDQWLEGMDIWLEMVGDMNLFKGKFALKNHDEIMAELCDLSFCEAAAE